MPFHRWPTIRKALSRVRLLRVLMSRWGQRPSGQNLVLGRNANELRWGKCDCGWCQAERKLARAEVRRARREARLEAAAEIADRDKQGDDQ